MELDDRVLADLLVERGLLTREQVAGYAQELAQPADPARAAPSLAVLLLTAGVLNETNLYELAQLHRARTMNPSDPKVATPQVRMSPLRTDAPTPAQGTAAPAAGLDDYEPTLALPVSKKAQPPADELTLAPPPKTKDPRASTGHEVRAQPAAKDPAKSTGHEIRATKAAAQAPGPGRKDPAKSTGHGEMKAVQADLPPRKDPLKSTGHEIRAIPGLSPPPASKRKGPPKAPPPRKAAPLSPAELELATQQTLVEKKNKGDMPAEAAEAAQYEDYCFKNFILTSELGKGGMGVVWKAWQRDFKRWVAIKFLEGESTSVLDRFIREAQSVAMLDHPNITRLYELGEFDGNYYIVMEYVDGQQMEQLLGKLSIDTTVKAFHAAAMAVDHAHKHNIIHRDIKPQNIMLTRTMKPFLMDFGLAKQRNADSSQTMAGMILGTPAYMSPEQAEGKFNKVDKRSDIYSLAATMYAVLAGQAPFVGRAVMDTLYKVVHTDPAPVRKLNPKVPPELDAIVMKAMSKTSAQRYLTAREFATDLQRFQNEEPVMAMQAPAGPRRVGGSSARGSGGSLVGIIIAIVVTLIAIVLGIVVMNRKTPTEGPTKSEAPPPATTGAKPPQPPSTAASLDRARREIDEAEAMLRSTDARWPAAAALAEKCLASAPQDAPDGQLVRGRALALLGRWEEAEEAYKRAPDHPPALLELGLMLVPVSRKRAAELVARGGPDPYARAWSALLSGREREAIDGASALIAAGARPEHHLLRARAHERALDGAAAFADVEAAVRLAPRHPHVLSAAVDCALRLVRDKEAEAYARAYLDFRPDDPDALIASARVKSHMGDRFEAAALADRAVRRAGRPSYHKFRAMIHQKTGNYREALADVGRLLERHPDDAFGLVIRGVSRRKTDDVAGARADFEAAVRAEPDYIRPHLNLAVLAIEQKNAPQALKHAEDALQTRASDAIDWLDLGKFLLERGREERALAAIDKAVQLTPHHRKPLEQRMQVHWALQDWPRAEADMKRMYEITGDELTYIGNLGALHVQKGDYTRALEHLNNALKLKPDDGDTLGNRGICYLRMKRFADAAADLKQAMRLLPPEQAKRMETDLQAAEEGLKNQ